MNLGILRGRQRRITNWKLQTQTHMDHATVECRNEAINMQNAPCACPHIKQEICNGVYWVTNDCAKGIKEGFRPRVAFAQTCAACPGRATRNQNSH